MLSVYVPRGNSLERIPSDTGEPLPDAAVWVDLITPTVQQDRLVERLLGTPVPTREEMQEIEFFQPALCGERRTLYDRDAAVPVRHGEAKDYSR